jgi:hypothetical protein
MPNKASYKSKGGKKDSAAKRSMNQPIPGTENVAPMSGTREPEEQDTKGRSGQFGGMGEPHMIKK